jgi:anti-sigma B factor antagonist
VVDYWFRFRHVGRILTPGIRAEPTAAPFLDGSAGAMRTTTTVSEGVAYLVVTGEVDLVWADELRETGEAALTPLAGTLRVDLSGVTFMDSTGLGALIAIQKKAEPSHVLILEKPTRSVRRVLEVTGLHEVFTIEPAS